MFKRFLALFLMLVLSGCSYFNTDKVYQDSRGTIVLKDTACKSEVILESAPDEIKGKMKEAQIVIGKEPQVKACWVDGKELGEQAANGYFVIAENGGYALFPKDSFK